jgi:hypothetical protein
LYSIPQREIIKGSPLDYLAGLKVDYSSAVGGYLQAKLRSLEEIVVNGKLHSTYSNWARYMQKVLEAPRHTALKVLALTKWNPVAGDDLWVDVCQAYSDYFPRRGGRLLELMELDDEYFAELKGAIGGGNCRNYKRFLEKVGTQRVIDVLAFVRENLLMHHDSGVSS